MKSCEGSIGYPKPSFPTDDPLSEEAITLPLHSPHLFQAVAFVPKALELTLPRVMTFEGKPTLLKPTSTSPPCLQTDIKSHITQSVLEGVKFVTPSTV